MDKRERILAAAYAHFSTKGYQKTTLNDIANSLKMSKKTIYFLFRNKEDLFLEAGKWKIDGLVKLGSDLILSDKSFVEKLVAYLELAHDNTRHLSPEVLRSVFNDTSKLSKLASEYLNDAVFDRFKSLIEQGRMEKMIDERVDPLVSLLVYKETLQSFLFGDSSEYSIATHEKEFHVFLSKQLRSFFRGLLSKEGTQLFDELLDQRPNLTKGYA